MKESDIKAKVDDFVSCLTKGKAKGPAVVSPPPSPKIAATEPQSPCINSQYKKDFNSLPNSYIGKGPIKEFLLEVMEQIPVCEA